MYALNKVKLIGYITETPELRTLPNGAEVCDINLRVISKINRDGAMMDSTSFHTVTLWRGLAKIITQYGQVGSQVFIEGRLKTDSWDGEDGKKRYKTKTIGDDLILLTPQNGGYPAVQSSVFSSGINEVEVIGNIVKDPEVRQTPNGNTVASTSIATNRKWKNQQSGEFQEEVEFHNVVLWDALATEAETQIKKGRKVYIKGRVQTRSWETPEGEKRYTTEVVGESIALLGSEAPIDMGQSTTQNTPMGNTAAAPVAAAPLPDAPVANEELPPIPAIEYESDIKPEDLPF